MQEVDKVANVISIEWAGSNFLVYTQPDDLGRPFRVIASRPLAPYIRSCSHLCKLPAHSPLQTDAAEFLLLWEPTSSFLPAVYTVFMLDHAYYYCLTTEA